MRRHVLFARHALSASGHSWVWSCCIVGALVSAAAARASGPPPEIEGVVRAPRNDLLRERLGAGWDNPVAGAGVDAVFGLVRGATDPSAGLVAANDNKLGYLASGDGPMCSAAATTSMPTPPNELGVLLEAPITEAERTIVRHQIASCSRRVERVADPWLLLAIVRLEESLGVPEEARGILAATWCWEAAMRVRPGSGDVGMSHGPYQMQAWFWQWCGLRGPTEDVLTAARCYWSRVEHHARTTECPDRWRVAEAMAANAMKYELWGCKAKSLHWDELTRWRQAAR